MKIAFLFLFLGAALADKVTFDNYHMIVVDRVESAHHVAMISGMVDRSAEELEISLVNDDVIIGGEAALLVAPQRVNDVIKIFKALGIEYSIPFENFQAHIDEVDAENEAARLEWSAKKAKGIMAAPNYYMTNTQLAAWLTEQAQGSSYATLVTIPNAGSAGSHPIYGLKIDGTTGSNPRHVFLGGGIHAREWISPATMNYMIYELLNDQSGDGKRMRESYVWHMYPVTNPDGYEFSHTSNRNWRKNRRNNAGSTCFGVDLNRNWGYLWGGSGSSGSPCSDTYRGASAFSEWETAAMRDEILAVGGSNIILYMDIHSYSQYWLVPWGGQNAKPADYSDLKAAGDAAAVAIQAAEGRSFLVGTPPDILYVAAGGALDWAKGGAGVKYSYSPELRPATAGQGGFVIPASNIYPSGREIFAGIVANIDTAETLG